MVLHIKCERKIYPHTLWAQRRTEKEEKAMKKEKKRNATQREISFKSKNNNSQPEKRVIMYINLYNSELRKYI